MSSCTEASLGLADRLRAGEAEVVARWREIAGKPLHGRLTEVELSRYVAELYELLLRLLGSGGALEPGAPAANRQAADRPRSGALAEDEVRAFLSDLSSSWARRGFTPSETAAFVFAAKEAIEVLPAGAAGGELDPAMMQFFRLIDDLALFTFETYVRAREEQLADQSRQLVELSTPVVKLWQGVVAVPLIGTLDSGRAQTVMEKLLQTLVDTGSEYAIIDITGVPAVDTQVAQHLLKTVVAARLMGAECVISGIRPQIAQTVVALGIQFGDIVTKASLADALVYVLRKGGVELVRRDG